MYLSETTSDWMLCQVGSIVLLQPGDAGGFLGMDVVGVVVLPGSC